jgi:type VI secretion system secreted protein Hcp
MAKTNIYLKLEGIDGESIDEDHKQWIEITKFTWGTSNGATFAIGQGGQATQGHVEEISIDKFCDKSSVTLFKNCTTGRHIPSGIISCLKLDGETRVQYMKIDLKDIMVKQVQWTGSGEDGILAESVHLVFAEFKETYKVQQDLGGLGGGREFGYNIQTAKAT